jgi:lipopolysaccharide/colanic/teichoic acid biosynthesis glycosyltransferase
MKRCFDIFASVFGLVVFAVPMGVIALMVWWKKGRPVFFRQQRPGQHGKPFVLLKFSTMLEAFDAKGRPLPDAERISEFGKWLRSTSLDELPELWNVLKGEMSLVGPRPLLMEYLPRYTPEQARRHEVPPGITGWAQVRGRNAISWEEKFKLDIWYVENWTIVLDLIILLNTVKKVILREGISAAGEATMPKFTGSAPAPQTLTPANP